MRQGLLDLISRLTCVLNLERQSHKKKIICIQDIIKVADLVKVTILRANTKSEIWFMQVKTSWKFRGSVVYVLSSNSFILFVYYLWFRGGILKKRISHNDLILEDNLLLL